MPQTASIKKNVFYSSFLTTANYLFTFLTYPYVSRVLGVEKIGAVNFIDSVINYFIMLSMLGIVIVGIRDVARTRNDREELNRTFSSILFLNIAFTVVALGALGITYLLMPELQGHGGLVMIGVVKLIANVFLMDWFFKGIENFKIITIRTFIVRTIYVVCTFLFIHSPEDYAVYFALIAASVLLNAIANCMYMRKYVSLTFSNLNIRGLLPSILILGLYMFFGNFYSSFNTMVLGIECGDVEVGYFTTATKLYTIFLSLFSAFTSVMMPRMSSLLKENRLDEYRYMFQKSVSLLIAFCLPLVFLSIIQSGNIILLISGKGYEGAVVPMMICMPLLLVIGYSQILINQGLMPLGKDKAILTSSIIGGLMALGLCFILIPRYGSVGSAMLWVISEISVNVVAGYFVYRHIRISFPIRQIGAALLWHSPLLVLLILLKEISGEFLVNLIVASAITFAYCFTLQCFVIKNQTIRGLFRIGHE